MSKLLHSCAWLWCTLAVCAVGSHVASANPLRLRADALARAQSPVGLLVLQADGQGEEHSWLSAEALVWATGSDDSEADALVVSVVARDPEGRGDLRLGRFVMTAGAIRPVHLDGIAANLRAPRHIRFESFAGLAVSPRFEASVLDWVYGARASRSLGGWGGAGIAMVQRHNRDGLADREIGVDSTASVAKWLDVAGRLAVDLLNPGVSEAQLSTSTRRGSLRAEVYASHLSPSRILPATSLFSVLGDVASQRGGTSLRWRAAPRLDLFTDLGMRAIGGDLGASLRGRALLRLNEKGSASASIEGRRESAPDVGWSGVRATAVLPIMDALSASTEVELVVPDDGAKGRVWPWALASLSWRPGAAWQAACAIEASASPEYRHRVDGMVRLARQWGSL